MVSAKDVVQALLVSAVAVGLLRVAEASTTTPPTTATPTATSTAAPPTTPAASASSTTVAIAAMRTLKKLLANVDPNLLAEGVTRFVFCASHHYKPIADAVTPHVREWGACSAKHPTDTDAQVGCFVRNQDSIPHLIMLGQQVGHMVGCLLSAGTSDVLCVKKVARAEDCVGMCSDARSSAPSNETATLTVISSPVPPTVRKDDCKLSAKAAAAAGPGTNLTAALDVLMKVVQCVPTYFNDTYQNMLDHIKIVNNCTLVHDDNWFGWVKCVVEGHDVKVLSTYMVKVRQAVACVVGGDLAGEVVCVRAVKTVEECRACGGHEAQAAEAAQPLGPTENCAA